MTWNSTSRPAVRGRLARYLGQLRHNLDAVGEQMREAVAHAVGHSVAEAVSETVYEALISHAPASSPLSSTAHRSTVLSAPTRRDGDESMWERPADTVLWRDPYPDDDDPPPADTDRPSEATRSRSSEPAARRWRQALAAGVQAAAWWLRRPRGPVSLLAALTVGALAGLTILVGPAGNAAHLVASALGLAYLLDLMRSASNVLTANLSSAWTRA